MTSIVMVLADDGSSTSSGIAGAWAPGVPTLISYLTSAAVLLYLLVQALKAFSERRRRGDAALESDVKRQAAQDTRQDSTVVELEKERAYARETRVRAETAEDKVRKVSDRVDDLDDQLRSFRWLVLSCPAPNPPGCPLSPVIARGQSPNLITETNTTPA